MEKKSTNEKHRNPGTAGRRISHGYSEIRKFTSNILPKTLNDLIQHVILTLQTTGFEVFFPLCPCVFLTFLPGSSFPGYL